MQYWLQQSVYYINGNICSSGDFLHIQLTKLKISYSDFRQIKKITNRPTDRKLCILESCSMCSYGVLWMSRLKEQTPKNLYIEFVYRTPYTIKLSSFNGNLPLFRNWFYWFPWLGYQKHCFSSLLCVGVFQLLIFLLWRTKSALTFYQS